MKLKTIVSKSQAGFSLVELMVVVAIIGILASMSVGQVQKQIAKSRQSEAKTDLSELYTSEASFQAEWSGYTTDFVAIGLVYNGNTMRYNAGFGAAFAPPAAYVAGGGNVNAAWLSSVTYCGGNALQCTVVPTNGVAPTVVAATATATAITFIAEANASIYNAGTDVWQINNNKSVINRINGIP